MILIKVGEHVNESCYNFFSFVISMCFAGKLLVYIHIHIYQHMLEDY